MRFQKGGEEWPVFHPPGLDEQQLCFSKLNCLTPSQPPLQLPNIRQKAQLNLPLKALAFESRGFLFSLGQEEANFPGLLSCLENGCEDETTLVLWGFYSSRDRSLVHTVMWSAGPSFESHLCHLAMKLWGRDPNSLGLSFLDAWCEQWCLPYREVAGSRRAVMGQIAGMDRAQEVLHHVGYRWRHGAIWREGLRASKTVPSLLQAWLPSSSLILLSPRPPAGMDSMPHGCWEMSHDTPIPPTMARSLYFLFNPHTAHLINLLKAKLKIAFFYFRGQGFVVV